MATTDLTIGGSGRVRLSRARRVQFGRIGFGVGLLLLWQWGAVALGPDLVAAPGAVAVRIGQWFVDGEIYHDLWVTLAEALLGMAYGLVLGIGLPLLFRLSDRLSNAVVPYIRGLMGIPKLALTPLFILWFGFGMGSKVALITLIVFIMVFEATFAGVNSVDQRLTRMARILGASEWKVTREIVFNSTLPFIFAALKTALPFSLSAAVVGEFLASLYGLGHLISYSRDMGDVTGVFAGIVVVTALVMALDLGLARLRARSLAWQSVDSRATL